MRPIIKRFATQLVVANLLLLSILIVLLSFTTSNATAASVDGTWSSSINGKGYMQTSHILDENFDVKLVLTQSGNTVSGTITTTVTYAQLHAGYESWGKPSIGQKSSNSVSGFMSGSVLTLSCYQPATSGVSGGVPYTTEASTTTWTLIVDGTQLTGNGTYVSGGMTYGYRFYLAAGDDSSMNLSGSVTAPVVVALMGGGACLAFSLMPSPRGRVPLSPGASGGAYSYQPSDVGTTGGASGAPTDPTYMGGAGLQYPQDYVNGVPVKPRFWQSQQHGPLCPVHGTMCNPNFTSSQDPGAWFCPKCAEQGRDAFPWGRQ